MKIVLLEPLGISETELSRHAETLVKAGHVFEAFPKSLDPAVQIERAKDADVIMIADMPLTGDVIRACPRLKYINIAFTGVDHVDLAAAKAQAIQVSNAAGYAAEAVAELTVGLMVALLRNLFPVEARARSGGTRAGLVGFELHGKTIGLIGVGSIGSRVAQLCRAFGCCLLGYKRHLTGNEPEGVIFVSLDELLAQSDIVSLHCPLTLETRGLMNDERIARMKSGAYLINTARGSVVESQALAAALNRGHLAGAAVDVFETEPPLDGNHPLLHAKNLIATPHVAFATHESMEKRAETVFNNLQHWLNGQPVNLVL